MATVTPRPTRNLEQDRVRVRNPLARVRSYIYRYVGIEGLAFVGLFLALWFWIGLVLDYGIFKLFLFDWVQETPWAARCTVLVLVVSGLLALLATRIIIRLFREFTDSAMALVLEKRFPDILGDRLITAVELSDPEAAAAFGYSPMLVRETIHEAADRVDQVPIREVFDWKRLVRRGMLVALLTLGLYALVGAGFCLARSLQREGKPLAGFGDFNEVATIWTERNILLHNTIWPRRAYLDILPFEGAVGLEGVHAPADPTELRIPQGTQPPALRVRAWKFIVADNHAAEGWRLLTWQDLGEQPSFVDGLDLPKLPESWIPRDSSTGMTVDEVELQLDAFPLRTQSAGDGAAKWNLASETEEGGVRPLMWADLTREKLAGLDVPGIPVAWDHRAKSAMIAGGAGNVITGMPFGAAAGMMIEPKSSILSVDEVEKQLEKAEKEGKPGLSVKPVRAVFDRLTQLATIREAIDRVSETAGDRAMRRVVRKLIVPEQVTLVSRGLRATSTSTLVRIAGNEFTGNFGELKETVSYTVQGEDYVTARRKITIVERPRVDSLESEEERPADLYYRPAKDGSPEDIRLKRQPLEASKLSVSGDTTTLEVPSGTFVTLKGVLSKPLYKIDLRVEAKDKKTFSGKAPVMDDEHHFSMILPDVRREQKFKLLYTDTDGVTGERKIVILPRPDNTPRVGEFNPDEVVRKGRGNEGFIIAAGCRIPFRGRVGDDYGLARVRYAVRVTPADFLSAQKVQGLLAVGALPLFYPGGPSFHGTGYLIALHQIMAGAAKEESGPEQSYDVPAFEQVITNTQTGGRRESLSRATIESLLKTRQKPNFRKLTREFTLLPDKWSESFSDKDEDMNYPNRWFKANDFRSPLGCDLPLWRLTYRDRDGKNRPLKDPDDTKPQKRFLVEVRLLVDDNYLDGDLDAKGQPIPHTGSSGETFTFTVVPENELLSRIAEEEEIKFREMEKAVKPVSDNLDRLREIQFSLSAGPGSVDVNQLTSFIARCDTLSDVLKTSHQDVKGVYSTYEKILKEMRTNQLSEDIQTKVYRTIYKPLADVSDRQFDRTIGEVAKLRRAMDDPSKGVPERVTAAQPYGASAKKELNDLVLQLRKILTAMEGLAKLNDLILELHRIEKQDEDLHSVLDTVYQKLLRKLLREGIKD